MSYPNVALQCDVEVSLILFLCCAGEVSFWVCFVSDFVYFLVSLSSFFARGCSGSSLHLMVIMVSRLLIGDNNLTRFWPAHQFSRVSLKGSLLVTATDLDTLDHALSQTDDRDQVIVSVLTSILLEEVNSLEISSSAFNICSEVVSRLAGMGPRSPSCQVRFFLPLML